MRCLPTVTRWHRGSPRSVQHQTPGTQAGSFQELGPQNWASSSRLEESANVRPPTPAIPGARLKGNPTFSLLQNHSSEGMTLVFFSLLHALILESFARMQTKGRKPFSPGNGLLRRIF